MSETFKICNGLRSKAKQEAQRQETYKCVMEIGFSMMPNSNVGGVVASFRPRFET